MYTPIILKVFRRYLCAYSQKQALFDPQLDTFDTVSHLSIKYTFLIELYLV